MSIVSKEELLAKRAQTPTGFPEDTVTIPGVGDVLVRGLSRFEAMHVQGLNNAVQREIATISIAMVEPAMSEAEIKAWMKAGGAGEFEPVSEKIQELSGMRREAAKEAYAEFEDDPGSEFRILPGAEVDNDGNAPADGDA